MSLETFLLVMFAGGPGLVALVIRVWEHRSERPMRDANAAQVLTETATGLVDKMEKRILQLEEALAEANEKITRLEAKLEASEKYATELAKEREQKRRLELENVRLRSMLPNRVQEATREGLLEDGPDDPNGDGL